MSEDFLRSAQETAQRKLNEIHRAVLASHLLDGVSADFFLGLVVYCLGSLEESLEGSLKAKIREVLDEVKGIWYWSILNERSTADGGDSSEQEKLRMWLRDPQR